MGGHHSAASLSDVWLTPPSILAALGPFDLDPCACSQPRPWATAAAHYTREIDGLSRPWFGRVWLNPPYGKALLPWLSRLAEHGRGTALVFARTETEWFADWVWGEASAVRFLTGRLTFHRPDGSPAAHNSGAPSCLVAYGDADAAELARCGLGGRFVDLRAPVAALAA